MSVILASKTNGYVQLTWTEVDADQEGKGGDQGRAKLESP